MVQTDLREASRKAKRLGVEVKPSTRKNKKLDVYKNGRKVATIGDKRYEDFNTHKDEKRRQLYKKRHENTRHVRGSPSYYSDRILW